MNRRLIFIFSFIFLSFFLISCEKPEIKSIEIVSVPETIEIGTIEEVGIKYLITYVDGTSDLEDLKREDIPDNHQKDFEIEGKHKISYFYKGFNVTLEIKIVNCVHDFLEATCTKSRYCTKCRKYYGEPLGHLESDWIIDKDSTCTEEGIKHADCARCGAKAISTATVAKKPHNFDVQIIPGTCTEEGKDIRRCLNEGCEYEVIKALPREHKCDKTLVQPTCEEQGYTIYKCTLCNYTYKDKYKDALGHKETDWIVDENPTCEKEGTRHTECERCKSNLIQLGTIPKINHNYVNNRCTMCGKGEFDPYIENGNVYIDFGRYPQTVVSDEKLIKALDKITKTNSFGYIEYNGEEYKKLLLNKDYYSRFQNGERPKKGNVYYFKVEPIKWRVLESEKGGYKLLSEYLLDSKQYHVSWSDRVVYGKTIHANNYNYSTIRAWLNGYNGTSYEVEDFTNKGFIDIAFTEEEKARIATTLVDNGPQSTGEPGNQYTCISTNDKVYLLSYEDVLNPSYGFNSKSNKIDAERQAIVTDYAVANFCSSGIFKENRGMGDWLLRSPSIEDPEYVKYVDSIGTVIYDIYTYIDSYGIRPALLLGYPVY